MTDKATGLNGVINVFKDKGWTSHDVVAKIRRLAKCKVGHTGTLDPGAKGVLPVCLGSATKISDYIMGERKEYTAEIIFGTATDTLDSYGKVVRELPVNFSTRQLMEVIDNFCGETEQLPPMYAAVKIDGVKLYELARKGIEVKRETRRINIYELQILEIDLAKGNPLEPKPAKFRALFRVLCSKGTYIRSLCADIGEALGTVAHMGDLLRTKSGGFCIEDAISIEKLEELSKKGMLTEAITPIDTVLKNFAKIAVHADADKFLKNGNPVKWDFAVCEKKEVKIGEQLLVYDYVGKLVGIHELCKIDGKCMLKPRVMF